jgi:hypothetical protein
VTTNTAASVRARLTNQAKASHRPFQEVLQHFGLERLLYRLSQSPHRGRFLLKGALLHGFRHLLPTNAEPPAFLLVAEPVERWFATPTVQSLAPKEPPSAISDGCGRR